MYRNSIDAPPSDINSQSAPNRDAKHPESTLLGSRECTLAMPKEVIRWAVSGTSKPSSLRKESSVHDGDTVEVEIEGIGMLRNPVVGSSQG